MSTEICGVSEFCVRLPSPLIHTATALLLFAVAARLYDARIGFWSALVYATLPGVSLSAGIISPDVPLLFFWALALYALVALIDDRGWWPAGLLGLARGFGLNAKYAMAYFLLCGALYLIATPERRWLLRDARLYASLALGLLLIAPNLVWNQLNGFATFAHTADNAKWTGSLFNPGRPRVYRGAVRRVRADPIRRPPGDHGPRLPGEAAGGGPVSHGVRPAGPGRGYRSGPAFASPCQLGGHQLSRRDRSYHRNPDPRSIVALAARFVGVAHFYWR
jgi:hypothetical protein